jgi:hypothetical protein
MRLLSIIPDGTAGANMAPLLRPMQWSRIPSTLRVVGIDYHFNNTEAKILRLITNGAVTPGATFEIAITYMPSSD